MSIQRFLSTLSVLLLFLSMLIFPQGVFQGASSGILLWFNTVLPTLLPFIILSNLLLRTPAIDWIANFTAPFMCRFFHVSSYGAFAILTGFLCGYPMGSKVTADLLKHNYISKNEGQYLLSFCNNTSPMFIISYIVWQNLQNSDLTLPVLFILMLSPIFCSFFFRRFHQIPFKTSTSVHPFSKVHYGSETLENLIDKCIMDGFETITKVGGYIMLFSILIALIEYIPYHSVLITSIILPSLEITTGIKILCSAPIRPNTQIAFVLALTAFGGWCSVAQTKSMIHGTGLSILPYIIEKLITALVTSLFASIYLLLLI